MKYLENAFKFLGKYYMLAVPLFISLALSAIVQGAGTAGMTANLKDILSMTGNPERFTDPSQFIKMFSSFVPFLIGGGVLAFILKFAVEPATYGMVSKALDTGSADLNDFVPSLRQNIVKYIIYWVANIVLWVAFSIAACIVMVIFGLLVAVLKGLGIALLVLAGIALVVAGIIIGVHISLWFAAMVIDGLDVMAAVKKSIGIVKSMFWTILGISLLVSIASSIASSILGIIFKWIPVIGPIILSVIPAAAGFVMIVFYISVYREKTGGNAAA